MQNLGPTSVFSSLLRLEGKLIHRFITQGGSRWLKSNANVEALCVFIFWMDGELKRLTLRMMVLDELKKEAERFFSIASPLRVTVNKEVEDPVVVHALWFICEFGKSHHLGVRIKGVGDPDESCWANVSFRQRESRNRNRISNKPLLFRKNGKAKRGTPVLSCDFSERTSARISESMLDPIDRQILAHRLQRSLGGWRCFPHRGSR